MLILLQFIQSISRFSFFTPLFFVFDFNCGCWKATTILSLLLLLFVFDFNCEKPLIEHKHLRDKGYWIGGSHTTFSTANYNGAFSYLPNSGCPRPLRQQPHRSAPAQTFTSCGSLQNLDLGNKKLSGNFLSTVVSKLPESLIFTCPTAIRLCSNFVTSGSSLGYVVDAMRNVCEANAVCRKAPTTSIIRNCVYC